MSRKSIILFLVSFLFHLPNHGFSEIDVINTKEDLIPYYNDPNVVLIASTGRSGSTLLSNLIHQTTTYTALKTHGLPPKANFQGKIIFIFSNPDKSAESAFHYFMANSMFGKLHLEHLESSDPNWLKEIGDTTSQTLEHNLLAYDALGISKQLLEWLFASTIPSSAENAQIIALKYENLWDLETQEALKNFLCLSSLSLPKQRDRGTYGLQQKEKEIRNKYNVGTDKEPKYTAYNKARVFWKKAPPFQFLKIR